MATNTPNWDFTLPDDGGDNEVWDNMLNGNWSSMDGILSQFVQMINIQDPVGTVKMLDSNVPIPVAWAECDGYQKGSYKTIDLRNRVVVGRGHRTNRFQKSGSVYWSDDSPPTQSEGTYRGQHSHFNPNKVTANLQRNNGSIPAETFQYSDNDVPDHLHIQRVAYWGCPGRWIVKFRDITIADLRAVTIP